MLISSMTARGWTSTTSCMNVPLSSENGPNDIACVQPITSVKNAVAALTSGTVMPVWSWPRRPGMESADAGSTDALIASAARENKTPEFIMIASFGWQASNFFVRGDLARRRQLAFDGLRIMREALGDAACHVP